MAARFFLSSPDWDSGLLTGEEGRHATKVLRLKKGAGIELFNGEGKVATAEVSEVDGKTLRFQIQEESHPAALLPEIHLYQAVPKGKNMDLIIQKAVELGVAHIHPLLTENTVAISDQPEKKREKWQKIALEACKQCKQPYLPEVHAPLSFSALETIPDGERLVGALHPRAVPMKNALEKAPPRGVLTLAVGPEGDFSEREYERLEELGFQPVSLGKLVLRVETATLYMISAVRFFYGEGGNELEI